MWFLGTELWSSCLHDKCFIDWAIVPTLPSFLKRRKMKEWFTLIHSLASFHEYMICIDFLNDDLSSTISSNSEVGECAHRGSPWPEAVLILLRHCWNGISIINMLYRSYYSFPSKHTLKIIPPLSILFPLFLLQWLCNWFWPAQCEHMCFLSHLGRSFKSHVQLLRCCGSI